MIRYFNDKEPKKSMLDGGGNEVVIGEISKLKLKNKLYEVVEQLSPTTYSLKDPETGKLKQRPGSCDTDCSSTILGDACRG